MNPELKLIIFEEKNILQELLDSLDEQYRLILLKDVLALEKVTTQIEAVGKKLASLEIKRRELVKEKNFKELIDSSEDKHTKVVYEEVKGLLKKLQDQKDVNNTLIKQKLFFTNKMINAIKPSKNVGTYNSYGKVNR